MKEYELKITRKLEQIITVEAESEEEALELAMEEMDDGFEAPYLCDIYADDWKVINKKELDD